MLTDEDAAYELVRTNGFTSGFDNAVQQFLQLGVIDQEMAERLRKRQRRNSESIGKGGIINWGQDGWYEGAQRTDPSFGNFARTMEESGKHLELAAADAASDKIVNLTPNPHKPEPYAAKGLVVGHVQSGKTTNFTAVAAKLADYDYRMVIVLAGIHNALRAQTQERLEKYLVPKDGIRWVSVTGRDHDFDLVDLKDTGQRTEKRLTAASFLSSQGKTSLLVVKKNATVLRKVKKWLGQPEALKQLKQNRVLVIDDEADQASVETSTINPLIRDILAMLPRSTYIGYTATPFANVFIDPADSDDLYPRDFIYPIPRPDGYFGAEKIFGRDVSGDENDPVDGYDMIRLIPEEDEFLYRPQNQDETPSFVPTMTAELRSAIRWFLLATAARWDREGPVDSSMLIHTSYETAVHNAYRPVLEHELAFLREEIRKPGSSITAELKKQWQDEIERVRAGEWGREHESFDVLLEYLPKVLEDCRIIIDNYKSDDRLSYDESDHTTVIAVGGNTLSRGITLHGLVSSFFIRPSNTYDTLLQMGRWFGFRTGYEDLPRIWMTNQLRRAFRHLALVEHEMRLDMDVYEQQKLTPMDFAVAIRTHPALMITRKMGAAQPARISYSGARVQVRVYERENLQTIKSNWRAGEKLIQQIERRANPEFLRGGSIVYRDVSVEPIMSFLDEYDVHPDQSDVNTSMILSYIQGQMEEENAPMSQWNVVIRAGEGNDGIFAGHELRLVNRAPIVGDEGVGPVADINTLMAPQDLVIDIKGINLSKARDKGENEMKKLRFNNPQVKGKGLLVLYPIDRFSEPKGRGSLANMDAAHHILGIGIVFPKPEKESDWKRSVVTTHVRVELPAFPENVDNAAPMNVD